MQMSLQQTRTIRGLWIDLLNTLKLRNGVQTGASIACGMMQKNVRKGKEIILLNAKNGRFNVIPDSMNWDNFYKKSRNYPLGIHRRFTT